MFCTNCGTKIEEQAKFCTNCGNTIEIGANHKKRGKAEIFLTCCILISVVFIIAMICVAFGGNSIYDCGLEIIDIIDKSINAEKYIQYRSESPEIWNYISELRKDDFSSPACVYAITISDQQNPSSFETLDRDVAAQLEKIQYNTIEENILYKSDFTPLIAAYTCNAEKAFKSNNLVESVMYLYTFNDAHPILVSFFKEDNRIALARGILIPDTKLNSMTKRDIAAYIFDASGYTVDVSVVSD